VYGRKPVLEALSNPSLTVDKIITADNAQGGTLTAILDAARRRGVPVQQASAHRVKVLAGNGHHDQGVLADVVAPGCDRSPSTSTSSPTCPATPVLAARAGRGDQPRQRRHGAAHRDGGRHRRRAGTPARRAGDRPAW